MSQNHLDLTEKYQIRLKTPPGANINNFPMQRAKCVVRFYLILGWRRYMEDAMIAKCPTHDGS